jgi:hypothetical protein
MSRPDVYDRYFTVREQLLQYTSIVSQGAPEQFAVQIIQTLSSNLPQITSCPDIGHFSGDQTLINFDTNDLQLNDLIRKYAETFDSSYISLNQIGDEVNRGFTQEAYLSDNRRRLLRGLVNEMENAVRLMQDSDLSFR